MLDQYPEGKSMRSMSQALLTKHICITHKQGVWGL